MPPETRTHDPALRRHPGALAAAVTLPVLLATAAFVLSERAEPTPAPRAIVAPPSQAPTREVIEPEMAATVAAILDRQPATGILSALQSQADRETVRKVLREVYERRGYRPIWFRETRPTGAARALVETLRNAADEGLSPRDYPADLLARRLDDLSLHPVPAAVIETDALLSQAFLVYGEHLATGRVDPRSLGPAWLLEPRKPDLAPFLESVADTGRLAPAVERLRPPHPAYEALREALARYREIQSAGGWPTVPEGPVLSPGDVADRARLSALALRLQAEGDLSRDAWKPEALVVFDDTLVAALERFQDRMGLTVDGKLGPETVETLDRSVSHRIRQIELNLERWRWLPENLGKRRIEVNLPAFLLDTVADGRVTSTMKVVVGKAGAATPAFSDEMTYVVINPYWNVPASIVASEIAPAAIADPGYIAAHDFEVVSGWGDAQHVVDPDAVDWYDALDGHWQYRVRQRPGPNNSLGRIKFMFPNDHSIYLHDTPATHLFERARRTFSHGCIRVEHPLDLAAFVFRDEPAWPRSRVERTIATGHQVQVNLREEIPVYLLYWTAWVDAGETVHFRDDVYGQDRALDAALDRL